MPDHQHQRAFYRIQYPGPARPRLETTSGSELEVFDCSESGLRYVLPPGTEPPALGTAIAGVVRFQTGAEVEVHGTVTRLHEDSVAVRLTREAIPFRVILDEQQYLRRNFLRHLDGRDPS